MPIFEVDASTAWGNLLSNDRSRWPGGQPFKPMAAPDFDASFSMRPGMKVMTIGSCFARTIESHLCRFDFDVVAKRVLHDTSSPDADYTHVLNQYNPQSMLQVIKCALGKSPALSLEDRLLAIEDGKYIDPHLHAPRPSSLQTCLKRIDRADRVYAELSSCDVAIVTLGLVELWFDQHTGLALNDGSGLVRHYLKSPMLKSAFPGRFVFRVMSFDEVHSAMHSVLAELHDAAPLCKVILTVSPVPLGGTFTGDDAILANSYSKSVLRCAAEHLCREFTFVDYFPSFESVMLSPRDSTWEDDNLHVRADVVAFNVNRMLARYVQA